MSHRNYPLVSAVIPTRNRPELVCRAVRSALYQTYPNIEVVVVVDGPDPATITTLEILNDPRVRIIALVQSVGGSEARNIGVREARGYWVALLDDDDEWLPAKLEHQIQSTRKANTDTVLLTSRYIFRAEGNVDHVGPALLPDQRKPILEYLFSPHGGFQTSTYVCSRKLLLEVPFDPGLRGLQDIDWIIRVVNRADVQVIAVPDALSIYYAPDQRRTITRTLTWEYRFDWARHHKDVLSHRAYSLFLSEFVFKRAVHDHAGFRIYLQVFKSAARYGSVDLCYVVRFALIAALPEHTRHKIRQTIRRCGFSHGVGLHQITHAMFCALGRAGATLRVQRLYPQKLTINKRYEDESCDHPSVVL